MNEFETLRLIALLDQTRENFQLMMPIADDEPVWKVVSYLIRSEISGQTVTISTLCDVSGLPYATARRLVNRLISQGLIARTARSRTGKTYALHPSQQLIASFEAYGRRMKALLAHTIGVRSTEETEEDYYFGGSLPQVVGSPKSKMPSDKGDLQFLLNDDNYALAVRNMWSDFRTNLGSTKDFKLLTCPNVHRELMENSQLPVSRYDVVGINLPWLGEFVEKNCLVPIGGMLQSSTSDGMHPDLQSLGKWRGDVYGVPIYTTVNLLAARIDLFAKAELSYPKTFDQVIAAGRTLANPAKNQFGIVWDAAPGMPIAHSFMFFMGACDSPIVSLRKNFRGYTIEDIDFDELEPLIDSSAGREALDFMHRLLEISPPDILNKAWDDALRIFLTGGAAMSYCWSMRAARFEYDVRSAVKRRVTYLAHPTCSGRAGAVPLGGFLLAVPSNLPQHRIRNAVSAIELMTSHENTKAYVSSHLPISPNFSMSTDPEMKASMPIASLADKWAAKGLLQNWQRPAIPQFHAIETILGEEIHVALSGVKSDQAALRDATIRMRRVLTRGERTHLVAVSGPSATPLLRRARLSEAGVAGC